MCKCKTSHTSNNSKHQSTGILHSDDSSYIVSGVIALYLNILPKEAAAHQVNTLGCKRMHNRYEPLVHNDMSDVLTAAVTFVGRQIQAD